MNTFTSFRIGAKTDRGLVRTGNEDSFAITTNLASKKWSPTESNEIFQSGTLGALMVLADGMGGTKGGGIASNLAIQSIQQYFNQISHIDAKREFFQYHLEEGIRRAHHSITDYISQVPEFKDMGTTICLAWLFQNYLFVSWVGDSRIYLQRKNNHLIALTKDHSYVQELIDSHRLKEDEAFFHPDKNIITQSLGDVTNPPSPGFHAYPIQASDRILLCSDGLNTMIRDYDIEQFLLTDEPSIYTAGNLIEAANKNGGADNTTVIVCDIDVLPAISDQLQLLELKHQEAPSIATNKMDSTRNRQPRSLVFTLLGLLLLAAIFVFINVERKTIEQGKKEEITEATDKPAVPLDQITSAESTGSQEDFEEQNYPTASQNVLVEGPELPVDASPETKKASNGKGGKKSDKPASATSKTEEKEPELKKSSITVVEVTPGLWYVSYGSFSSQDGCIDAIRRLKSKYNKVLMGKCPSGNRFYAIGSEKGYENKNLVPINVRENAYPVCQ